MRCLRVQSSVLAPAIAHTQITPERYGSTSSAAPVDAHTHKIPPVSRLQRRLDELKRGAKQQTNASLIQFSLCLSKEHSLLSVYSKVVQKELILQIEPV